MELLKRHGFTDIVVTLQFMPEEIQDYFGDGSDWGVNIRYSIEDTPAGTAGSVKMAEEELDLRGERFLVISGDALTGADLTRLVKFHEEKNSDATMVLKSVENPLDFGIVITEEDGRISRFLEKPAWGQVFSDTVNTGIYLLEASVMDQIPDPERDEYDFSKELFPKLLNAGRPLYGYVTDEYWEDIGTLEQYADAQRDVLDGKLRTARPPGTRLWENIYISPRARVNEESLEGPVFIGENARVDPGARKPVLDPRREHRRRIRRPRRAERGCGRIIRRRRGRAFGHVGRQVFLCPGACPRSRAERARGRRNHRRRRDHLARRKSLSAQNGRERGKHNPEPDPRDDGPPYHF